MSSTPRRRRTATGLIAAGALVATGGLAGFGPTGASASSHREAPMIAGLPQFDTTDVYAFVSPDQASAGTTTLIANWIPFEEPAGGPNFYPFAEDGHYDINIDNNGDARPDIVYRWTFKTKYTNKDSFLYNNGPVTSLDDENLLHRQSYKLDVWKDGRWKRAFQNAPVAPSYVGKASMPDYAALSNSAIVSKDGLTSFAGQADDPFFLDLRVFDLLYGGDLSEVGEDTLAGFSVNSIALQVPTASLTKGNDPVIGVWSSTYREDSRGRDVQVSRLGSPLVNEVVIPIRDKDKFNASEPKDDPQFLKYVTKPELPKVIQAVYGIPAPAEPRNDLVQVFLTGVPGLNQPANLKAPGEMIRLNTSIASVASPNRLGVIAGDTQGYPNGRRLADDVLDISLQVVEGELVGSPNDLGDAVNQNDKAFRGAFPYLALPSAGSDTPSQIHTGFTPLTGGGAPDGSGGNPFPAAPVALVSFGLALAALGAYALRRRPVLVTA